MGNNLLLRVTYVQPPVRLLTRSLVLLICACLPLPFCSCSLCAGYAFGPCVLLVCIDSCAVCRSAASAAFSSLALACWRLRFFALVRVW